MADHDTASCPDCARYSNANVDAWGITGVTGHVVKVRGENRFAAEFEGEVEVVEPMQVEPVQVGPDTYPHILAHNPDPWAKEREWLRSAYVLATFSPDPSTQNGAYLMDPRGFGIIKHAQTRSVNEFPRNVPDNPERWARPTKYAFVEHAERNAIYAAARHGIKTKGLTLVVAEGACADCARAIIQAGIKRMVCHDLDEDHSHWDESITRAMTMLEEAGVEVTMVTGRIPGAPWVLRNGRMVQP